MQAWRERLVKQLEDLRGEDHLEGKGAETKGTRRSREGPRRELGPRREVSREGWELWTVGEVEVGLQGERRREGCRRAWVVPFGRETTKMGGERGGGGGRRGEERGGGGGGREGGRGGGSLWLVWKRKMEMVYLVSIEAIFFLQNGGPRHFLIRTQQTSGGED